MTEPAPSATLVQLTDLHIVADGEEPRNGGDTAKTLEAALSAIADAALTPAAVLLTGDLTENGTPEQYRRLRAIVEPAAERIGAPLIYAAGNHDDRAALREHLLGEAPSTEPLDTVVRLGDMRIVVLDSTVPGRAYGQLRPEQLDWLRSELAGSAPSGTVIAMHHPPLPTASPLAAAIPFLGREDLADAITGTDVRLVLAGHTHVVSAGALAGVPVWTGGATETVIDGLTPGAGMRVLATPSVSRVDLFPDTLITTSVPVSAPVAAEQSAQQVEPLIARLRAELPA